MKFSSSTDGPLGAVGTAVTLAASVGAAGRGRGRPFGGLLRAWVLLGH